MCGVAQSSSYLVKEIMCKGGNPRASTQHSRREQASACFLRECFNACICSQSHRRAPELAGSETGHCGSLAGLPGWRAADTSPSSRSLPRLLSARASPAAARARV